MRKLQLFKLKTVSTASFQSKVAIVPALCNKPSHFSTIGYEGKYVTGILTFCMKGFGGELIFSQIIAFQLSYIPLQAPFKMGHRTYFV